ncbi:MAG TPA: hypothetical protein DCQ06_01635, partial [Myxococcales bacterium]|nr:hypothetical protein [Myxococcales bacterium]
MRKQITVISLLILPVLACSSEQGNATATPCEPGLVLPCDCVFSTGIATCQADGTPGICNCAVRYVGDNPDAYSSAADGVSNDGGASDTALAPIDSGGVPPTDTSIADTGWSDTGLFDSGASWDTQQPDTSQQDTGSAPLQDSSIVDSGGTDVSQTDSSQSDSSQSDSS